jgi:hypothetical protein
MLKWILEKQAWGYMDLIHLAQYMDWWRAFVNTNISSDSIKYWEILD